MPFTLAHPAAILPLRRFEFLHLIPLTIGSVTPDVPYYFPDRWGRSFNDTHTFYGSFVPCLPIGMALLLFTLVMREPLTALLSTQGRALCLTQIEQFAAKRWNWLIAVLSLLVGSWTHIMWDSFTHPAGWTTARVAALSAPVELFGWNTEINHLLQYVSSVFGLLVLAWWYRRQRAAVPQWLPEYPLTPWMRVLLWSLIALIATVLGRAAVSEAHQYGDGLVLSHRDRPADPHHRLVRSDLLCSRRSSGRPGPLRRRTRFPAIGHVRKPITPRTLPMTAAVAPRTGKNRRLDRK